MIGISFNLALVQVRAILLPQTIQAEDRSWVRQAFSSHAAQTVITGEPPLVLELTPIEDVGADRGPLETEMRDAADGELPWLQECLPSLEAEARRRVTEPKASACFVVAVRLRIAAGMARNGPEDAPEYVFDMEVEYLGVVDLEAVERCVKHTWPGASTSPREPVRPSDAGEAAGYVGPKTPSEA